MDKDYLEGLIEEILYIWGQPIDLDDLSKIIKESNKREIKSCIEAMILKRNEQKSGLLIRQVGQSYQFVTRKNHDIYFKDLIKAKDKKLSSSALETLSIIAYKQPITRVEIDKIRGISSQSTVDNLLNRGLIMENGRLDKIGKPIIYITTDLFLQYFDIENLDQLPEISSIGEIEDEN